MLLEMLLKWLASGFEVWGPALSPMTTSFFSVMIGAMPFIVIASLASAILEVFVSKDRIARLIPRNGFLGVLLAPLLGAIIPMCECGIVPVARRMIQKGVPGAAAITFMLSNPILNPLSVYATYLAFPFAPQMVWWRVGMSYVIAVIIGFVIHYGIKRPQTRQILLDKHLQIAGGATNAPEVTHLHGNTLGERIQACLEHAASEFFDVLKYFMIGAGIAAVSQAMISRSFLEAIGGGMVLSVLVMVGFAFVICICSEADAFVAATFASTFTPGALLAFLVAGPMTDIKNTMIMSNQFRRPFVIGLNVMILSLTALFGIGINLWLGFGG